MNYYQLLLLHSWNRWLVLLSAALVISLSIRGMILSKSFGKLDNIAGASFIGFLHLQALLGLLLYFFFSPFTQQAFNDWSATMKIKELRYWGVEHIFGMVIAVAIAQTGRIKVKKSATDSTRHKRSLIWYLTAIVIILGTVYFADRPWVR